MRFAHRVILTLSACVLGLGALGLAQAPTRSTNDGVYAAAQADRGKATFQAKCTACHESSQFAGSDFLSGWSKEPLSSLYEMISGTMPADNPGGLQPQEYADVIAYFLSLNGFPAGAEELKGGKEASAAIRIEPPSTK